MAKSTKKGFKLPHTFVIIIFIVLVATAMTWIIPAGEFVRYENASGRSIIDPNQFSYKRTDDEERTAIHAGYGIVYYDNTVFYCFIRCFPAEHLMVKI